MPTSQRPQKIASLIARLEERAPTETAEAWDNVGLLAGDSQWETTGAVVSVDLTREALQEAKNRKFNLIVNHHPAIFPAGKGMSRLTPGRADRPDALDALLFEAVREGIAVYCSHTNFDQCALEVQNRVSESLGVTPKGRLLDPSKEMLTKLVVFIPETHIERVRAAIFEAGGGQIGNYDSCSFSTQGVGTFRGNGETNPFIGKRGELEHAKEIRFETIIPSGLTSQILQALKKAHPYEEVAYDLYPVLQGPTPKGISKGLGYGFWGDLTENIPFSELSQRVKSSFQVNGFWVTEPVPKSVKRVAFVAGKGASFLSSAIRQKVEVFITGEVGYHGVLDAARKGMAVIELGHRESERFFLEVMETWLKSEELQTLQLNTRRQILYV